MPNPDMRCGKKAYWLQVYYAAILHDVDTLYVIRVDAAEAMQSLRRATPHGLPLSLRLPENRRTWRGRYMSKRARYSCYIVRSCIYTRNNNRRM